MARFYTQKYIHHTVQLMSKTHNYWYIIDMCYFEKHKTLFDNLLYIYLYLCQISLMCNRFCKSNKMFLCCKYRIRLDILLMDFVEFLCIMIHQFKILYHKSNKSYPSCMLCNIMGIQYKTNQKKCNLEHTYHRINYF